LVEQLDLYDKEEEEVVHYNWEVVRHLDLVWEPFLVASEYHFVEVEVEEHQAVPSSVVLLEEAYNLEEASWV
jgi:hypothetical protein